MLRWRSWPAAACTLLSAVVAAATALDAEAGALSGAIEYSDETRSDRRLLDADGALRLYSTRGLGEWMYCFDQPLEEGVCVLTSTETSTTTASSTSLTSFSSTSVSTTTGTSTHTLSTCTIYPDCYETCEILIQQPNEPCLNMFCHSCDKAHMCDTACQICSPNTTTSATSSVSSTSDSSTTSLTSTPTSFTTVSTSVTTESTMTTTVSTSTSASSQTECNSVNLGGDQWCQMACDPRNNYCSPQVCKVLFCPDCIGDMAGMCDEMCGYCTTVTNTSTSVSTGTSVSDTSATRSTTTTVTTTTVSSTSISTKTTTASETSITVSLTTNSEVTTTSASSQTTTTTSVSSETTTCFRYSDCVPACPELLHMCYTTFCPTCSAARLCDDSCLAHTGDHATFCAFNTTETETSSVTSTSATSTTTGTSSTTLTTFSGTSSTTFTQTTPTETSNTVTSTFSLCWSMDIWEGDLCNQTDCNPGNPYCGDDACALLFCPTCGLFAGMCDHTCNFCTTLTNTSSATTATSTDTTVTTTTTTTRTGTTYSGSSATLTTSTSTSESTISMTTSTRTTKTSTGLTGTSTSKSSTITLTTTSCFKYADCLSICNETWSQCDVIYCPTCRGAHLCDFTCGFCAENTTTTETSSFTHSTTSWTSTETPTTSKSTTSATNATITTSKSTASTTETTFSTTDTSCVQEDNAQFNPAEYDNSTHFCQAQCVFFQGFGVANGHTSICGACDAVFCPTCALPGYCDLTCDFCYRVTTTETSTVSSGTETSLSTVSQTSQTCRPCQVKAMLDSMDLVSLIDTQRDCEDVLRCGQTTTCTVYPVSSFGECMDSFTMEFECQENWLPTSETTWTMGPDWAADSVFAYQQPGEIPSGSETALAMFDDEGMRYATLIDVVGTFGVHCQSCGFSAVSYDMDKECRQFEIDVTFGPNILDEQVNENLIKGYQVSLVRACEDPDKPHTIITNLAFVEKNLAYTGSAEQCYCYGRETYSATVRGDIPDIVSDWRLMVSPVMRDGSVVPVGVTTDVIVDYCAWHATVDLRWYFDDELPQEVCITTSTETASSTTSETCGPLGCTETSVSTSETSHTTVSTETMTATSCPMLPDCWDTCPELVKGPSGNEDLCLTVFGKGGIFYHECDTTCNITTCISTTTESVTSTSTASTTSESSSTSLSTTSGTTSSLTTFSTTVSTFSGTTTASTDTKCHAVDLAEEFFPQNAPCEGAGCQPTTICNALCFNATCDTVPCDDLFCPTCVYSGLCDKTCDYCSSSTMTSSHTSSNTTTSESSTSMTYSTKTTTITVTTTTETSTSESSSTSLTSETESSQTETHSSTTETTGSYTTTLSSTATTCFTYEDCFDTCLWLINGSTPCGYDSCTCDRVFCPTCDAAHMCDTTCGFCAFNTTTSATSSGTTTSQSSTTTASTTSESSTVSRTTTSVSSLSTYTSTSESSTTTDTSCYKENLKTDQFCETTCLGTGPANPCEEPCETLFCLDCLYSGMCDKTCNFCTTMTNTSSTSRTSETTTRTTSTTETTTSETTGSLTSTTETSTSQTSTMSSSSTVTSSSETSTTTTMSTDSTESEASRTETSTTCFKLDDCLSTCCYMLVDCDSVFCPTCVHQRMCDYSCGFCHDNSTTTDTSSTTLSTDSQTTLSQTTDSTTSISTTSRSSISETSTSATSTSETSTVTLCNQTDRAGEEFCNATCLTPNGCPQDICETLFCPTCRFAAACDRRCGYCTNIHTTTKTSTPTTTTASTTSESSSTTITCDMCHIRTDFPLVGCRNTLACGEYVFCEAFVGPCMDVVQLQFFCPTDIHDYDMDWMANFSLGSVLPNNPGIYAWGGDLFHANISATPSWLTDEHGMKGATLVSATGNLTVHCQVCGWDEYQGGLLDEDDARYNITVNLTFGPMVDQTGAVNETDVEGYAVVVVRTHEDELYARSRLDQAAAFIPVDMVADDPSPNQCACFGGDKYKVTIQAVLPEEEDEYRLMVVPVLRCTDSVESWADDSGYTCDDYAGNGWCTSTGGYGWTWNVESWGPFNASGLNGYSATQACCSCGGGTNARGLAGPLPLGVRTVPINDTYQLNTTTSTLTMVSTTLSSSTISNTSTTTATDTSFSTSSLTTDTLTTNTSITNTSFTTATETTRSTTTSTTTVMFVVSGALSIDASGTQEDVEAAMIAALAELLGVPASWIQLTATPARRLAEDLARRLSSTTWQAQYEVLASNTESQDIQQRMTEFASTPETFQTELVSSWNSTATLNAVIAITEPERLVVTVTATATETLTSVTTASTLTVTHTTTATTETATTTTATTTTRTTTSATTSSLTSGTSRTTVSVTHTTGSFSVTQTSLSTLSATLTSGTTSSVTNTSGTTSTNTSASVTHTTGSFSVTMTNTSETSTTTSSVSSTTATATHSSQTLSATSSSTTVLTDTLTTTTVTTTTVTTTTVTITTVTTGTSVTTITSGTVSTVTVTTGSAITTLTATATTVSATTGSDTSGSDTTGSDTSGSDTTGTDTASSITATGTTATGTSSSGTSVSSVTATQSTGTSTTATSTTATTYTQGPSTSITGSFSLTAEVAEAEVEPAAKTALASMYSVAESQVTVTVTAAQGSGRRLTATTYDVSYEVVATSFQAKSAVGDNFDAAAAQQALQDHMSTNLGVPVTVTSFQTPELEVMETVALAASDSSLPTGSDSGNTAEASSGLPVLIIALSAVGFVVLLALAGFITRHLYVRRRSRRLSTGSGDDAARDLRNPNSPPQEEDLVADVESPSRGGASDTQTGQQPRRAMENQALHDRWPPMDTINRSGGFPVDMVCHDWDTDRYPLGPPTCTRPELLWD